MLISELNLTLRMKKLFNVFKSIVLLILVILTFSYIWLAVILSC